MYITENSDEISPHLLTADFNARSFLMYHRRENERIREMSFHEIDHHYHSRKYSTHIHPRGFARLANSPMITVGMIDELSEELLDDYFSLFRNHWQRSKMNFTRRIDKIQSELNRQTSLALKKATCEYAKVLSQWISKKK